MAHLCFIQYWMFLFFPSELSFNSNITWLCAVNSLVTKPCKYWPQNLRIALAEKKKYSHLHHCHWGLCIFPLRNPSFSRLDNMDWCGCFQLSGGNLFLEIGSKNLVWQGRLRVAQVQNRKFAEQLINLNNWVKTFFILKVRINFQQHSYPKLNWDVQVEWTNGSCAEDKNQQTDAL